MKLIGIILFFIASNVFALSFNEAIRHLDGHELVKEIQDQSEAISHQGTMAGSWGDPMLKLAAKNFPQKTLRFNDSPMTGIEMGISQKIPLTFKYSYLEDSFRALSKSYILQSFDRKQFLIKQLWEVLINQKKLYEELKILEENQIWISKILKVSKKLYANGKISQQAILDIQIRNSEIESKVSNKNFELEQIQDHLEYFLGKDSFVNIKTIPWEILYNSSDNRKDYQDLAFKEKIRSKDLNLTATNLEYIPDLSFSFGIVKRSDLDGKGNFIGGQLSFTLPFSSMKYANKKKVVLEKYALEKSYNNFLRTKRRNTILLEKDIQKIKSEINIIENKTIKFAKNSLAITSKSYGLGSASYTELLQSELKLQEILMQKIMLESTRDIKLVTLKYELGEPLND